MCLQRVSEAKSFPSKLWRQHSMYLHTSQRCRLGTGDQRLARPCVPPADVCCVGHIRRHLENYAYLCKKYCLPETALPSSDDDSDARASALRALDEDLTLNHINNTRPLSVCLQLIHGLGAFLFV